MIVDIIISYFLELWEMTSAERLECQRTHSLHLFSSSIGLLTKTTEQKWDEEEKKKKELKNV